MPDETYGIRHYDRPDIGKFQAPDRWIQSCEQLVCSVYGRRGNPVEQSGLTGVSVAYQRYRRNVCTLARPAALVALTTHLLETFMDRLDALTQKTAVGFQLGFTGASQPNTAFLTLKVRPAANKAR